MPVPFKVSISRKAQGDSITAEGSIPDAEWDVLWRFADYAGELRTAKLLNYEPMWQIALHFDGQGDVVSHNIPPKIEVRELMHLLRPFILENEDTFFYKVVNILSKHFPDAEFRSFFQAWRDRYSGKDSQSALKIEIGDVVLNSERTLRIWLNAYEYHRDEDKRLVIDSLKTRAPFEMVEGIFIDLLTRQAEAILLAERFLRKLADAPSATRARREAV